MTKRSIKLKVNGNQYQIETEPNFTLLNLLRGNLGLTGSKDGCQEGECGTCTVLLDGQPVNSCLTLAAQCDGREVVLSSVALLENNISPTHAEIRTALAGNLCRCTGYNKIIEAVELAAQELRNG